MSPENFLKISTGIPHIDEEHIQLLDMISDITFKVKAGNLDVLQQIKTLIKTFDHHCSTEETVMKTVNYPLFEHHVRAHAEMRELLSSTIAGDIVIRSEALLHDIFTITITKHISEYDLPLAYYVHNRGAFEVSNYTGYPSKKGSAKNLSSLKPI